MMHIFRNCVSNCTYLNGSFSIMCCDVIANFENVCSLTKQRKG